MELITDTELGTPVVVHSDQLEWLAPPMPGADRRRLDWIGGEVAPAASIVHYALNGQLSIPTYIDGGEHTALDGSFQDERDDCPTGTYAQNPPTTSHMTASDEGCTIFVKRWQLNLEDRTQLRKTTTDDLAVSVIGVATAELHHDAFDFVTYRQLEADAMLGNTDICGVEVLEVRGSISEGGNTLSIGAWLRLPDGEALNTTAGDDGAKVRIKTGHLAHAEPPVV